MATAEGCGGECERCVKGMDRASAEENGGRRWPKTEFWKKGFQNGLNALNDLSSSFYRVCRRWNRFSWCNRTPRVSFGFAKFFILAKPPTDGPLYQELREWPRRSSKLLENAS